MQLLKPAWVSSDGLAFMSIDIHPDGSRFVTGGQGTDCGRICIWNLKPILDSKSAKDKTVPKLLTQMDHHLGCVNSVRWSHDGRFLASGGDDKLAMIWQKSAFSGGSIFGGGGKVHVEQWRLHQTLRGHDGDVLDVAWGPGDVVLATASVDNNIIIWNIERLPEQVTILRGHTSLVKGVFFDPVGKYLASQSDDKTLRIWKTSDWSLETVIDEPFQESGATTHVLRPGWSPEGSIIVSAHAMNGGGPTAQIVERSSWKANRDFVGHKKAVSCVKFNSRVFEKANNTENGKTDMFVVVALGSRDRSFSVWTTGLQRPFFVVNDAFDQGVLDMSWSKDGNLLMACSMDGSVAAVVLSPNEIGKPISDARLFELMRSQYGKNCGTIANLKTSGPNITNGGPVVIENPDMLKREDEIKTTNGHHNDMSLGSTSCSKTRLWPNQNPTDKQIEARTSDGKRRITPIFIPPPSAENGADSKFGLEFGSASTQEKSTIAIEKRDDIIVQPNISPSKAHENGEKNPPEKEKPEPEKKPTEPTVNIIQVKKKPVAAVNSQEPPVNVIQVKKKPGPVNNHSCPPKKTDPTPTQPPQSNSSASKKRKRIAVLSDSSEDDTDKEDSKDSNVMEVDNKPPVSVKKAELHKINDDVNKSSKLKESKVKKPDLMTSKHQIDSSPKRPRGRPPLTRETSFNNSDLIKSPPAPKSQPQPQETSQPQHQQPPIGSQFKLPALKMDKCKTYNFTMMNSCKIVVSVTSNGPKLHVVKVSSEKYNWSALMTSSIVTVGASLEVIVVVCKNGSLHLFKPGDRGQRLVPPLQLPSGASKLTFQNGQLALVTTCGHLYIWTLDPRPKIKMSKENVQSLFGSNSYVAKILLSPEVILITSSGKSFTFDQDLGTWICLADTSSSIQACSNYATASTNLPSATRNLPLASLEYLTPVHPPRMQNAVTDETRALANITHCRNQRLAAEYLNSPQEYQYWLMAEVKHLASLTDVDGLRACFDWLMGSSYAGAKSKEELVMSSLKKHDLLKAGLMVIKSNLNLQRLYTEYDDQLNSAAEVCEIDKFLHV